MCTFAPDFETVSYSKGQPYHKSGNLICTFEFHCWNSSTRMTLTLEKSYDKFFFQSLRRQLANVRPPRDMDGKSTIKLQCKQMIVSFS